MRKIGWNRVLVLALAAGLLGGCAVGGRGAGGESSQTGGGEPRTESRSGSSEGEPIPGQGAEARPGNAFCALDAGERPRLIDELCQYDPAGITPCVDDYTVALDLSNVDNREQFYLQGQAAEKLAKNGFVVLGSAGAEFFETYEINRYAQVPNFVTVDSLMHTYHLYFSHLLKEIERTYLADNILRLSDRMLSNSMDQYESLKGSEWEEAAARNVAFFTVGAKLLDESTAVSGPVEETVGLELDRIARAEGVEVSGITGEREDYSQYAPRGYYEGDETLERYFRAMMWYGRMHFAQEEEDLDRSALLISLALSGDSESFDLWEAVYAVTSFFAGDSDDPGVCEYVPAIREAYGDSLSLEELLGNREAFETFRGEIAGLPMPQINSLPVYLWEDNVVPGFRFMGQRFTIDAAVMQKLVYRSVGENGAGEKRMLPDVLDVPAALGSDLALEILEEQGAADFAGYSENMEKLKEGLSGENETLWSASLYAGWLNTLRPLLSEKGQGYPPFMQNEEWLKKDLECFAGSFTELKHDTILYSKQVLAEMGGWGEEEIDDRGYVEPEPLVYAQFAHLAEQTAQGLKAYGMLSSGDEENLSRLASAARQLLAISEKELRDEALTDEEYDFIRGYGGSIEHFWHEVMKGENGSQTVSTREYPAALVVDIAADPGGEVLEAATGDPSVIYVVVKVGGSLRIARGSVYSFYQFPWPLEDRLTDSKWRQMMGLQADEKGYYHYDQTVSRPDWTKSYRYE